MLYQREPVENRAPMSDNAPVAQDDPTIVRTIPSLEIPSPAVVAATPPPQPAPQPAVSVVKATAKSDLLNDPVIELMMFQFRAQVMGRLANLRLLPRNEAVRLGMDLEKLESFLYARDGKELDITLREVFTLIRDLGGQPGLALLPPQPGS